MAKTNTVLNNEIKTKFLELVSSFLTLQGEEVLRVGSNEVALPIVDSESNEKWLVLTFKVPTGSRDGDSYDGYSMAQDYELKVAEKANKAKESAKKKADKIAKDKAMRDAKKEG